MNGERPLSTEIYDILIKKGVGIDAVAVCEDRVVVSIEDGDWYHDHRACDTVMANMGYTCIKERMARGYGEESGDDSYSSEHIYKKL